MFNFLKNVPAVVAAEKAGERTNIFALVPLENFHLRNYVGTRKNIVFVIREQNWVDRVSKQRELYKSYLYRSDFNMSDFGRSVLNLFVPVWYSTGS